MWRMKTLYEIEQIRLMKRQKYYSYVKAICCVVMSIFIIG